MILTLTYPEISPIIVQIGPLAVRWYGLMYAIGFAVSYFLVRAQLKKGRLSKKNIDIDSLFLHLIIGLILGARLGYILFYNLSSYIQNPSDIFAVWQGGMSFHGGLIGVIIAGLIFTRRNKIDFWQLADVVIVTAPIGLGLGRIGNFINGELYGRATNVPWAMVFPTGGPQPRHPSQLYEFLLEGVVLFLVLWFLKDKKLKSGSLISIFLILYGVFRIFVELFREPDVQLGFIFDHITMGQILSSMMIIIGVLLYYYRNKTKS